MLTNGRTDPLSSMAKSYDQFYYVAENYYGAKGGGYADFLGDYTTSTEDLTLIEYGEDGVNVKLIDHNGGCTLYDTCLGHCFPTEPPAVCSASEITFWPGYVDYYSWNHRCCVDGWSHGEEVVEFFMANSCDGTTIAPTPTPSDAPTQNEASIMEGGSSAGRAGSHWAVFASAATIMVALLFE
ncbi:hypothetical protein TrRE_jg13075 [Triparma retinervis]|uniref:Uncharacterized protein n=1 Tax=Triparma retinervis TaxID=2557542 RepID=A0A9W7FIC8_9STRA|nr:hypothetical protein TrRE_jg13075 [Triparma retinervis]